MGMSFTTKPQADVEREELFTVDGVEYTIATVVPASAGLEYVRRYIEVSPDAAMMYAMRTALGGDGFRVLLSATDVSTEDMRTVMDACSALLIGALNGPKETP